MKKIAIQGISGCFHEMAATKFFGKDIEVIECTSFKSLCQTMAEDQEIYGVMAIENTLAGSLLPNYSLIQKFGFQVIGEVYLHIVMNLMTYPGTPINNIRYILSHSVALAQCEDFTDTLSNIELKEYHDTAAAAKWVKENKSTDTGAIANHLSAQLYGLEIVAKSIETHKKNFTRFLILSSHKKQIVDANKASLSLELSHEPGSLSNVLNIFKEEKVNLTKIQSVPIIGKPYQYAFKIDLQWEDYQHYINAINQVEKICSNILVHGEYKAANYLA